MRRYESIIVFNPALNETQLKDEQKKVEAILSANKASEITVDNWGRKEIAYLVKKQKMGHFVAFDFKSGNSDVIKTLSGLLRIADNVLKFQTHRINDKVRKFKGNPRRSMNPDGQFDEFGDIEADY